MKFYRDSNGKVSGFESDGSQDYLIPDGLTLMTAAEVEAHINPPKTAAQLKADILAQIASMERAEQLPRVTRESTMAFAVMLAASQGVGEPALYASNIAYKKIKDFDVAIAALRDQAAAL